MLEREGQTRLTRTEDGVTVESDSLYVALTTLAQEVRDGQAFNISGQRHGSVWAVSARVPAQRPPSEVPYCQPCGCLTNDGGAHRGDCPDYVTRLSGDGARYWTRRCCTWAGHNHAPTCEEQYK